MTLLTERRTVARKNAISTDPNRSPDLPSLDRIDAIRDLLRHYEERRHEARQRHKSRDQGLTGPEVYERITLDRPLYNAITEYGAHSLDQLETIKALPGRYITSFDIVDEDNLALTLYESTDVGVVWSEPTAYLYLSDELLTEVVASTRKVDQILDLYAVIKTDERVEGISPDALLKLATDLVVD